MKTTIFLGLMLLLFSCDLPIERAETAFTPPGPDELLLDLTDNSRFLTVDQVVDRIVNKDPGLRLVDVRSHDQYDRFSLPGAVNIPLSDLLAENNRELLDCKRHAIAFFSNGDVRARQAWQLMRLQGCEELFIMQGGLNEWTVKILNPQEPPATASAEEMEKYHFRKAASLYLIGQSKALEPEPYVDPVRVRPSPKKIEVKAKPKKKVVEEEEGC